MLFCIREEKKNRIMAQSIVLGHFYDKISNYMIFMPLGEACTRLSSRTRAAA